MKSLRIFFIAVFIAVFVAVILCSYGIYSKEQKYVDLGISLVCYMIPPLIVALIRVKKYGNKKAEAKTIRMFMILFLIAILSTVLIYNYEYRIRGMCCFRHSRSDPGLLRFEKEKRQKSGKHKQSTGWL